MHFRWSSLSWHSTFRHSLLLVLSLWLWLLNKDTFCFKHVSCRWISYCSSFNTFRNVINVRSWYHASNSVVTFGHSWIFVFHYRLTAYPTIFVHLFKTSFSLRAKLFKVGNTEVLNHISWYNVFTTRGLKVYVITYIFSIRSRRNIVT